MTEQEHIVVPDFVGVPVHIAIEQATDQRLVLTSDDLDGAGLHARTWPGLYWVKTQDVAPGSVVESWSRVTVTFVAEGETHSGVGAALADPPPSLSQHAEPEDPTGVETPSF